MKLTYRECKASRPFKENKTPRKLSDGKGLQLWVMPNGSKYWRYKYRIGGKERLLPLGVFPEVSLREARMEHQKAYDLVLSGIDPNVQTKKKRLINQMTNAATFEAIAHEWLDKKRSEVKETTYKRILGRLKRDVFPEIGAIPISEVTPLILLAMLRKIEQRGAHEMVRACRQYCGQILRYAVATGRAERDYTSDIKEALKTRKVTHQPALSPKEIPEFLKALNENRCRLFWQTRLALEMLMLTFVRPIELVTCEWVEINDTRWVLPPEKTKKEKPLIVPLSKQALEILDKLKGSNRTSKYVFVHQYDASKHMSRDALSKAVRNLGFQGRHTAHGFRSMAMTTILEKLDYPFHVIDAQLGHGKRNPLGSAYDRSEFLDERTVMMQDWADYISSLSTYDIQDDACEIQS